ncbi:5-oxoprolinase subunit PxpA [Microbulbifer bruguierae]|uniref:5-oxoprolinase subunit PxpA n=1 Tax=Microbulbifer bruguierae TaxID=3029061 RepID=A0ABY8NKV7_9GAMM|nr:5-oxoprolinase subunit PxpA [Microbulbifer bruguierae]WGL18243.1 5-oxoprolinase subunit PxpA [Microbulbifer bruguierae]
MARTFIDINCDLGEGKSAEDCARDARIMPFISRCSIACGGHAGNAETIDLSLQNAKRHRLAIGAHPGYTDPENFGRKSLAIDTSDLLKSVFDQIEVLQRAADRHAVELSHVKLHGALYNDAEADSELADALVRMIHSEFPQLRILGLANAAVEASARCIGHPFLREGFMDRRYLNDHQLAPRNRPGAVIAEFSLCLQQTLSLIRGNEFYSIDHQPLTFTTDSICLHGDNPHAETIARDLQRALRHASIEIRS